jgi:hypothetical protein
MTTEPRESLTLWVCLDCYYAHHGLEDESGHTPYREPLSLVGDGDLSAGMVWDEHECSNAVDIDPWAGPVECECEHVTFSWSHCDGCGSTLGGAREALTYWPTADELTGTEAES